MRWDVRFRYHGSGEPYVAVSDIGSHCFYSREQALNAYRGGLALRIARFGNVYQLDEIEFGSGDLVVDYVANVGDLCLYSKANGIEIRYVSRTLP